VRGHTFTQLSLFQRNVGGPDAMTTPFPPHKVIGNTPGHSRGCTTWTLRTEEGGRVYDVVIIGSFGTNPGFKLVNNAEVPGIAENSTGPSKSHGHSPATSRSDRTLGCIT
jgi:hypothetical protein